MILLLINYGVIIFTQNLKIFFYNFHVESMCVYMFLQWVVHLYMRAKMCVDLRMTLMLRMKIIALIVEAGHLGRTQSPIGLAFLANQFPLGMHLHLELQAGGGGVWVFTCILGDTNSHART